MRIKLHHILLGLLVAGAAALSAKAAGDWDEDARSRKAAYIFLDAMDDLSSEAYTDYTNKLRRATALDPADPDIAAEYAELLLQTTQMDSAETEPASGLYGDALLPTPPTMPTPPPWPKWPRSYRSTPTWRPCGKLCATPSRAATTGSKAASAP